MMKRKSGIVPLGLLHKDGAGCKLFDYLSCDERKGLKLFKEHVADTSQETSPQGEAKSAGLRE